jgi:predicted RNase H-like HicB family nuclease
MPDREKRLREARINRLGTHRSVVDYQVVIEHDPETRAYTATVPGLPIVVDATSEEEAVRLTKEAIALYLEDAPGPSTTG